MAKDGKAMVRVAADGVTETLKDSEDEATNENLGALPDLKAISQDGDGSASHRSVVKGKQISRASSKLRRSSSHRTITMAVEVVLPPFKFQQKTIWNLLLAGRLLQPLPTMKLLHLRLSHEILLPKGSHKAQSLFSKSELKHVSSEHQMTTGESSEELAEPAAITHDDDGSSLAATVDYDCTSDKEAHNSIVGAEQTVSKSLNGWAKLRSPKDQRSWSQTLPLRAITHAKKSQPSGMHSTQEAHQGNSEAKLGDTAEDEEMSMPLDQEYTITTSNIVDGKPLEPTEKARFCTSATSHLVDLTKDRLPKSLSKVVFSYRTDEWIKHLSNADTSEPEATYIEPYASEQGVQEAPRYVDVEDLLKAVADNIIHPLAAKRSELSMTQASFIQPYSKGIEKKHILPM
ncbi:hypothetical protein V8C42DRAFT_363220 [Trichoderma barbatum]